jgi:hypothetical protein
MTGRHSSRLERMTAPLARQLPDAQETALLHACLARGARAERAWNDCVESLGRAGRRQDPGSALARFNVLLPLLSWNLQRNRIRVSGRLGTCLRAAAVTEELRWQKYSSICRPALDTLRAAGIPYIVLKAAAFCESVYPSPALRHGSDIDLLLRHDDLPAAVEALRRQGWNQEPERVPPSTTHAPPLVHASRLPLELHHRLLIPYYTLPYETLWSRSEAGLATGVPARVLCAADALVYVCAHAMLGGRILHWVPDAWFIVERHGALDWDTVTSVVRASRLGLPLYVALEFLATRLAVPVPPAVLDELRECAEATDRQGRSAARPWPKGNVGQIWRSGGRRRLLRLAERAFPPPRSYALRYDLPLWRVPLSYISRLVWFARGRARVARL